jgi:Ras-related GTP-binding protein C/D
MHRGGASGSAARDKSPEKILLCGLPRAGKTSVANVVFKKMSPHETLFLETTQKPEHRSVGHANHLVPFHLWDYPGSYNCEDIDEQVFRKTGAVVIVIDAQMDDYSEAVTNAAKLIARSHRVNPSIGYDILIHKVDGDMFLNEEVKVECQRDINAMLDRELRTHQVDVPVLFHRTSIYDYSVFEAFSKLVQKLIPNLDLLEQLLDQLINASKMEKVYLFDLVSKIYLASDSQPMDDSYELCSDMIDVVIDVSVIYGQHDSADHLLAGETKSSCSIALNNNLVLYLREVDKQLALACLVKEDAFDRQHLVDYNISLFKEALLQLFPPSSLESPRS